MDSLKQPLTEVQLELLQLFSRPVDVADWLEIRRMITHYFANKAIQETDKLWEEQGWNEQTMANWLEAHQRTPYKPQ